jgi:hypothetical protein
MRHSLTCVLVLAAVVPGVGCAELARQPVESLSEPDSSLQRQASTSSAAWRRFLADLEDATDRLDAQLAEMNAVERAAAHRSLMRIATIASFTALEDADPAHPYFAPMDPVHFKAAGNSPDAEYYQAPLSGEFEYRIRGQRGTAAFLSFQVYARTKKGFRTDSALIDTELDLDEDGRFEIIASADPADATQSASWLRLSPETFAVTVRTYSLDPATDTPPELEIEVLGGPSRFSPVSDEEMARRIDAMRFQFGFFVNADRWSAPMRKHPNRFMAGPLDPNIGFARNVQYVRGAWALEPDEALVIEGHPPESRYWMIQIANRFAEAFEHHHRVVSLNSSQIELEDDGRYRIVIAHEDPGTQNWLDAGGYSRGSMTFRWVDLPNAVAPETRVVPLAELRAAR